MAMSLLFIIILAGFAYFISVNRAKSVAGGVLTRLHSQPVYHGWLGVFVLILPIGLIYGLFQFYFITIFPPYFVPLVALGFGAFTLAFFLRAIHQKLRARLMVEFILQLAVAIASGVAIATTLGIILSLIVETIRFFSLVPIQDFLFGLKWSPQIALRADQVGSSGAFGIIPLFAGTFLIMLVALTLAIPVGLMSAIYLSDYANSRIRAWVKPMIELLAGIPTVVYGFFAALYVGPALRQWGVSMGLDIASESALAAGLVMGVMIIPFISSLADDVMSAVPRALRDGALAMGATKSEMITGIVIPAALPGIAGGILLAASRAIGETMIVVMAAGLSANLTLNPLEATTTITVQIVTLLTGDQEFDSAKTLSAFALGLTLFIVTLGLNILAQKIVRRFREQYE